MKEKLYNMGSWQGDARDEDLTLFHDMRRREHRNFLYPLPDDIDSSPSSTPARTDRDLLPLDAEKNDYDWLLTPPSTPLFPSLDQDGPIVNLSQRRVLTRSASASKTARLSYQQEPTPKLTHGRNPSPKRPSTASSTSSTLSTSRGRPLSPSLTARSGATVRSSSPCRISTPTGRNSTTASRSNSRSLTPTLRRNSTSPSPANRTGVTSGRSRGKSLSPKLAPWEPSLPGFSADPPPNLRTSLSERRIQRGVSQASRNGYRVRGSSEEMIDVDSTSRWHMDSPDGSGNWSLSYSNDHNSSQTSRASVVSYEDDVDMAESVISVSTGLDSVSKSANIVSSKAEDSSSKRCVLPAKRQMRSAGSAGDAAPLLSFGARKSYERQSGQRRNAQTMFRPLMSSAPVTSFYRSGGMHVRASGPFMDASATQTSSLPMSINERSHVRPATEVAVDNVLSEKPACKDSLFGKQETIQEESEASSLSEEEALACQSGSHPLRDIEEASAASKQQANNLMDGHKIDGFTVLNTKQENLVESKEGSHTRKNGVLKHLKQGSLGDDKAQQEDTGCAMDLDRTEPSICAEGCLEGTFVDRKNKSLLPCAAGHASSFNNSCEPISEEKKEKECHVEDPKVVTVGKTHSPYLGMGISSSPHGSQRVPSDLGSFRKLSPMKGSFTRSHDGSLISEKSGSCDFSMSDSHSFMRSLASAFGSGESVEGHLECPGGAVVRGAPSEPNGVVDKTLSMERVLSNLERDSFRKGLPSSVSPIGMVCDGSECNYSEASATSAVPTGADVLNQSRLSHLMSDLINTALDASTCEVSSSNLENPISDKVAEEDVLSIIGSCASRITMLDGDALQHECTGIICDGQSRRLTDALLVAPTLAGEISNEDDASLMQLPGVPSLKRSITLEEATDTILFCSSIVHELVYKAANLAIENEEQKISKSSISKRDFVALFGFSGADNRANGVKMHKPTRDRRHRPVVDTTICETSSRVQKQWMVHRQTPAVTMRQNPMERIENAVMGNHEEIHEPTMSVLPKGKIKQGKRVQCRCSCCMM